MCTGFSNKMDQEMAKSMGIKGFLMKPLIKSQLATTIRKVLDGGKTDPAREVVISPYGMGGSPH